MGPGTPGIFFIMFKLINHIGYKSGIPHYWFHAFITALVQIVLFWFTGSIEFATGIAFGFYLGREITDYEKLGYFDVLGLAFPAITALIIYLIL
jgi:hypothetical protein